MLKYIKDAIAWDRFAGENGAWVRISDLNYIESEKGYSPALNGRTRSIFHSVYPYQDWMEEYIGTNKNLTKDKRIEKVFDL